MTEAPLPPNVYCLPQKDFEAIPGSPWVYWVSAQIRELFRILPPLGEIAFPTVGLQTGENFRFLRYWWEVGNNRVSHHCYDREVAIATKKRWFPYMKGGSYRKWYGNQEYVVNWFKDGYEIQNLFGANGRLASRPQNMGFYFKEGVTYSYLTSGSFNTRYSPGGFIFDVAGSSLFPKNISLFLAILNSKFAGYILKLINPTVNFQVGDLARIPISKTSSVIIENLVVNALQLNKQFSMLNESTYDFTAPESWKYGIDNQEHSETRLNEVEAKLENEVFDLYGIAPEDRTAIEDELSVGHMSEAEEIGEELKTEDEEDTLQTISLEDLSLRWISYAVGVVLGRFKPGIAGSLGSTIYHPSDFAIGSLPAPEEAEFDELVGTPDRFANVDGQGGRHVFSVQVEKALQALALPDGIAVLNEDSPRDLVKLTIQALELMLGEAEAREVIQTATGGDTTTSLSASLRKFLVKDFFANWHSKWYRKRPVYWPIQSSKRAYGFVLFHEKITRDTFYTLQREPYLDTKRNAVALKIADLQGTLAHSSGAARKRLEKELDDLRKLADELAEFAKDLEAITLGGYEPEVDWIDDGVILRMAPLWKVIPIWKSEPKKYWERLEAGDFDWCHIAMKYWPERVREKCRKNKSFAIAHGHEEWYEGR